MAVRGRGCLSRVPPSLASDARGALRRCILVAVCGCLIAGLLVLVLFVIVPLPLWPVLVVALVVVFILAAALGLFRDIGRWFSR